MNAAIPQPVFALSNPAGLYDPAPNGYSHLARVEPGARWIIVAGQGGESADGALDPDFRRQVRQAMRNLLTALEAGGARGRDMVKLTVLIVDHSHERLRVFGEELAAAFGADHRPTCTLIPVPRLALDGMLFEIEAVAAVAP